MILTWNKTETKYCLGSNKRGCQCGSLKERENDESKQEAEVEMEAVPRMEGAMSFIRPIATVA